jgi:hypothetical protein
MTTEYEPNTEAIHKDTDVKTSTMVSTQIRPT